ncbi:hypothetical protein EDD36DRAFT_450115 [Exophiala viscosa]|uniref:Uncharacterized protein n=1 Tax=Exophiala viscosa TaxID=2486360 RepID=A0AAN6E623_9EURO|nr:hypothetical protein EDD36DRAFT_450115 [Exophiala viscosa]
MFSRSPAIITSALAAFFVLGYFVIILREDGRWPFTSSNHRLSASHDSKHNAVTQGSSAGNTYREIFSVSTSQKRYFEIKGFEAYNASNPSILPHPSRNGSYIVVAQRERKTFDTYQMVCEAVFQSDVLECTAPPVNLNMSQVHGSKCDGRAKWHNFVTGPHDARVFQGPDGSYIVYGSASDYTCLGQWIQAFRPLIEVYDDDKASVASTHPGFTNATEMRRPDRIASPMEKNWFTFWDREGQIYVHHDLVPKRVFARLIADGSVGKDLAPFATTDAMCLDQLLPPCTREHQVAIHQATNSLSITLCKRSDANCWPSDDNTFVMAIFQQKYSQPFNLVYRPYAVLFRQSAPFSIYAVSERSFWVHGHRVLSGEEDFLDNFKNKTSGKGNRKRELPESPAEFHFLTSMNWNLPGASYHGYIDDVIILGLGIEDERSGGIDVLAGDLLQDLAYCTGA